MLYLVILRSPWDKQERLLLLLLSRFSHVWLCDPIDSSPPGSPIPGILQARTLEWVAISFSNAWKWKVKVKSLSRVLLFSTPCTAAYQAPLSMGFSRQEYWSGVPSPSPKQERHYYLFFALMETKLRRSNSRQKAQDPGFLVLPSTVKWFWGFWVIGIRWRPALLGDSGGVSWGPEKPYLSS